MDDFLEILYESLIHDQNIIHRKIESWNKVKSRQFRNNETTKYSATDKLINYLTKHQMNLLEHLSNDMSLLTKLRSVFRHESWC